MRTTYISTRTPISQLPLLSCASYLLNPEVLSRSSRQHAWSTVTQDHTLDVSNSRTFLPHSCRSEVTGLPSFAASHRAVVVTVFFGSQHVFLLL